MGVKALRSAGFVAWSLKGLWVLISAKDPSITAEPVRTAGLSQQSCRDFWFWPVWTGSLEQQTPRSSNISEYLPIIQDQIPEVRPEAGGGGGVLRPKRAQKYLKCWFIVGMKSSIKYLCQINK